MGRSAGILPACSNGSSPFKKTGCEERLINAQVEYLRSDITEISRLRRLRKFLVQAQSAGFHDSTVQRLNELGCGSAALGRLPLFGFDGLRLVELS